MLQPRNYFGPFDAECLNCCSFTRSDDSLANPCTFIVVPDETRDVALVLTYTKNNVRHSDTIHFPVGDIPSPKLYFGGFSGETINTAETRFFTAYESPDNPYAYPTEIRYWKLTIGKKVFDGEGSTISKAASKQLRSVKTGTPFIAEVQVFMPDQSLRTISANFKTGVYIEPRKPLLNPNLKHM